jgi:predicted RNase H-like nuclease (RuvC/YqgF family)
MSAEIEDIKLDIVILHNRVDTSNAKNTKSTEEISKLRLQLEKEKHMNRMLEDRAKTAEEERDSLRLALKLLMQDHVNKSLANDLSTQENTAGRLLRKQQVMARPVRSKQRYQAMV